MKTFVHPFATKITEDQVISNKAFPLVRELAHKYGLMVICMKDALIQPEYNVIYMSREDGIPVCQVFFMRDKEALAIRNCMKAKSRGSSQENKLTYFGKRASFVMKAIEEEKLIPTNTEEFISHVLGYTILAGVNSYSESYGEIRKSSHLSGEIAHQLIEIVLGNRNASTLSIESMDKVQYALDKYREADKTRVERKKELGELFSSPMWAIMYDKTDSFCIGKLNLIPQWGDESTAAPRSLEIKITQPFKRMADVTEVSELIPTMTMLKVAIQQSETRDKTFVGESGFFPSNFEGVLPELRVIAPRTGNRWDSTVLLSPRLLLVAA